MREIEQLSDQQLMDQLQKAEIADRILTSQEWSIVHEAMRRVVTQLKDKLATHDPTDKIGIMRIQERIALFDQGFLPALLQNLRAVGEFTYQELLERQRYSDLYGRLVNRL